MSIFQKSYKIRVSSIVFIILLISFIASLLVFCLSKNPNSKIISLLSSLSAGLAVAIIQFIISWHDFEQTEKLSNLELIDILYNRDSRVQYEGYIKHIQKNLDIMGVTASRFFNDFADTDENAPDNAKVMLMVLARPVIVRILLPESNMLFDETKRASATQVFNKVKSLEEKYPGKIELRFFNHTPSHSIFRFDDECIIGPVFPNLESKYTPALHLKNSSPIASKYLAYFDKEWEDARKA